MPVNEGRICLGKSEVKANTVMFLKSIFLVKNRFSYIELDVCDGKLGRPPPPPQRYRIECLSIGLYTLGRQREGKL